MSRASIAAIVAVVVATGAATPLTAVAEEKSTVEKPVTVPPAPSAAPTNQSAEEIIVKERLRASGLRGIKNLQRKPDGTWEGRAVKDKTEVAVTVDTAGNVSFQ